jgi:hypothetical protein
MSSNPILKQKVLELTRDPFVQMVNFEIHGLRVTGQHYSVLGDLIADGNGRVSR